MHLHELNSPTRYVYCLVDTEGGRFKLGSTDALNFAPSMSTAYCISNSFQVGYVEELAMMAMRVLLEQYADKRVDDKAERSDDSAWLDIACFDEVRGILCSVPHTVPPTVLSLTSLTAYQALLCAHLDKLLGIENED